MPNRNLSESEIDTLRPRDLAEYIDHTLLRPDATEIEIRKLCEEAMEYRFKTVCIESQWLPTAVSALKGSAVLPITVIGFPGGSVVTETKVDEVKRSVDAGAGELDMVLNRKYLKSLCYQLVWRDMHTVVEAAQGRPVKVILETSELTLGEKTIACALAVAAGVSFVKTSTGFSKGGATEEDVRLMRSIVGPEVGVKASGGIRSFADALGMLRAGANRLGTSASVAIVTDGPAAGTKY